MDRTYQIIIKGESVNSNTSPIAGDSRESDTAKGKGLLTKNDAKAFMQAMTAYRAVKSFASQIVSHEVSLVSLRTGSNELQERANFDLTVLNKGVGIIEAVATAAAVGGWVGAIVGFVASTAHTVIGFSQAQNRIDTARAVENQSLQLNYIRAGASGSRGR